MQTSDLSILEGHILGDGSITRSNPNAQRALISFTSKHLDYVEWVRDRVLALSGRPIRTYDRYDERTGKVYRIHMIQSLSSLELGLQRERWYTPTKQVPKDLQVLTPELCLGWYMDDGTPASKGGLYLSTDCLHLDGVNQLRSMLELHGFKTGAHRNGNGYRTYIQKKSAQDFLDWIGVCPVPSMGYKYVLKG